MKTKVVNLYGGPGSGKSTTAAMLFAKMKLAGVNCEYVQEYAKDKAWEFSQTEGKLKVLEAQEYIFAKQHFRMRRCAEEVDLIITDSPIILGKIYTSDDFDLPSLKNVVDEAYNLYDNLDVFLNRVKPFNPKGRFQDEESAKLIDKKIFGLLKDYVIVDGDELAADEIMYFIGASSNRATGMMHNELRMLKATNLIRGNNERIYSTRVPQN